MNANVIKTLNYMKRNGIRKAVGLVKERLTAHYDVDYSFQELPTEVLQEQRKASKQFDCQPLISIVVPAYETKPEFMEALLESVNGQSYEKWELVIADASSSNVVEDTVKLYAQKYAVSLQTKETEKQPDVEKCIRYQRLEKNEGISGNTNQALEFVTGDYIGLLDHDDLLTRDALYEMVLKINEAAKQEISLRMLYSDEDKCNTDGRYHYEPNVKTRFNLDFLLSNNYICHFLVAKTELMKECGFRPEYDGAQDFDIILRMSAQVKEEEIAHISKVLYHWRCHEDSTAANPASKYYAYEAGKRAVQDFVNQKNWTATVKDTEHMGFYKVIYEPDVLTVRTDVGAVGGNVIDRENKITSGILNEEGICLMKGIPSYYSGPANKYSVSRDALFGIDARTLRVREEYISLYEEIMKVPYEADLKKRDKAYCNQLDEAIWRQRSKALCNAIQADGYKILWEPQIKVYR